MKRRKTALLFLSILACSFLLLSACTDNAEKPTEPVVSSPQPAEPPPDSPPPDIASSPSVESPVQTQPQTPTPQGDTLIYEYYESSGDGIGELLLRFEITNVCETKKVVVPYDELFDLEYDVYTVYPGATATVLDVFIRPETLSPEFAAETAAQNAGDGGRIKIVPGMEPLELTTGDSLNVLSIYGIESGGGILEFELAGEEQEP